MLTFLMIQSLQLMLKYLMFACDTWYSIDTSGNFLCNFLFTCILIAANTLGSGNITVVMQISCLSDRKVSASLYILYL